MAAESVDILIVGGGPVGAALALALRDSDHSVILAEARSAGPDGGPNGKSGDGRAIALSYSSRLILERLDAWTGLASTPIETIHVSHHGGFGRTLIRAADCDLPALGYVVGYDSLQRGLLAVPCSGRRIFSAKLIRFDGSTAVVRTHDGELAFAPRLTVFADGAGVGNGGAAPEFIKDYGQVAVVASVTTRPAHRGRAWERFAPEGPLALLPCGAHYSLVWTVRPERAAKLCALDAPAFLAQLHAAFGGRVGEFVETGERAGFALALRFGRDEAQARSLRIGNAAQTLHPVAGQGFNLGLRDSWELARQVLDTRDLGSERFCAGYRHARLLDRRASIRFTDSLVSLFSNANPILKFGRGAGLLALDLLPFARRFVARRMIYGARALP